MTIETTFYIVSLAFLLSIVFSGKKTIEFKNVIKDLAEDLNAIKADFTGMESEKGLAEQALRSAVYHLNSISREGQVTRVDYTYNGEILHIPETLQTPAFVMNKVGPCYLHKDTKGSVIILPCTPYQIREYGNVKVGDKSFWTIEKIES